MVCVVLPPQVLSLKMHSTLAFADAAVRKTIAPLTAHTHEKVEASVVKDLS